MGCELEDFERVAALYCRRWEKRSIDAMRALLVDKVRLSEVAEKYEMKPQQAIVLRTRFNEYMLRAATVKMSAENFMHSVPPESASIFEPFKTDIKKLIAKKYSETQISEYLKANGVSVPMEDLISYLRTIHENLGSSKSKGRGR